MSPHFFQVIFDSVHRKPWPIRAKRLGLHPIQVIQYIIIYNNIIQVIQLYIFYHVIFWLVASQPRRFLWPSTDGYRGAKVASSMRHAEEKQTSAAAVQSRIALWLPWTTLHAWDLWMNELWAEGRVRHESEMLEWAMDNKNQNCTMFDVDWWKNPQHSIFCWGTKNMQNTILNSARVAEWLLRFLVLCSSSTSKFI